MKQKNLAGIGAIMGFATAALSIVIPTDGASYIASPVLLAIAIVSAWFWHKGTYGTEKEKKWVEKNF